MGVQHINIVAVTGNLTRDPELRSTPAGTSVCSLRIAVNGRRKDQSGQWIDDPNFFDVTVWGGQGEACAQYLSKGRPLAVQGRLDWHEWKAKDGTGRQQVQIVAQSVQFLNARGDGDDGQQQQQQQTAEPDLPPDTSQFKEAPTSAGAAADDDIPF